MLFVLRKYLSSCFDCECVREPWSSIESWIVIKTEKIVIINTKDVTYGIPIKDSHALIHIILLPKQYISLQRFRYKTLRNQIIIVLHRKQRYKSLEKSNIVYKQEVYKYLFEQNLQTTRVFCTYYYIKIVYNAKPSMKDVWLTKWCFWLNKINLNNILGLWLLTT